jgi:hypothetical protein
MTVRKYRKVYVSEDLVEAVRAMSINVLGEGDGLTHFNFITMLKWSGSAYFLVYESNIVWRLKRGGLTNRNFMNMCFSSSDYDHVNLQVASVGSDSLEIKDRNNSLNFLAFELMRGVSYDFMLHKLFESTFYIHTVNVRGAMHDLTFIVSRSGEKIVQRMDLNIRWALHTAKSPKEIALVVKCFSGQNVQLGTALEGGNVALFETKYPNIRIVFERLYG